MLLIHTTSVLQSAQQLQSVQLTKGELDVEFIHGSKGPLHFSLLTTDTNKGKAVVMNSLPVRIRLLVYVNVNHIFVSSFLWSFFNSSDICLT